MEKRLSRSDYIFSLILVFMLVCVAGAFFFGVEIGRSRAETQFAATMAKQEDASLKPGAYDQQVLVSFYHTIYAPYRGFADRWFDNMKRLESDGTVDAAALLKQLSKSADDQYAVLAAAAAPDTSPLLVEAHQNLMKGLKLFADSSMKWQSQANAIRPGTLPAELDKDPYVQEAKKFALLGQQQFYTSVVKWNETVDNSVQGAGLLGQASFTIKDWSQMNFNVKNAVVASVMLNEKRFLALYPQDLTSRIDEIIANGQAKKMNLDSIPSIVNMLADTNAARKGDYIALKTKWYANETLPQIPFFYEVN